MSLEGQIARGINTLPHIVTWVVDRELEL